MRRRFRYLLEFYSGFIGRCLVSGSSDSPLASNCCSAVGPGSRWLYGCADEICWPPQRRKYACANDFSQKVRAYSGSYSLSSKKLATRV